MTYYLQEDRCSIRFTSVSCRSWKKDNGVNLALCCESDTDITSSMQRRTDKKNISNSEWFSSFLLCRTMTLQPIAHVHLNFRQCELL